jgi:VanZ family protein
LSEATFRRLWIGAVVAFAAFIVASSLSPQPLVPVETLSDKVSHFLAYLALGLLGSGIATPGRLWLTMLRCFVLGAAVEIAQAQLTDHRHAEWADLAANTAGILVAWIIAGQGRAGWAYRALGRLRRDGPS